MMSTKIEKFERLVRNTESQYRRMDSGALTGRNATGSDDALNYKLEQLRELARTDEVCDKLDRNERLAARWNRLERRTVGLS